jgi:hypothetical protein
MKNLAVFFIASFAIGATPILIGIALVYAVARLLSCGTAKTAESPHRPPPHPLFNRTKKWLITRLPIAQNAKKRHNQKINSFIPSYYN